jgi:hypothetical protein
MRQEIKTAYDLKYAVEASGNERYFFTRNTMKCFGDTMRNYGVRRVTVETRRGAVEAFELFRKRPVKMNNQASAYFHAETFAQVFPIKEWEGK